VRELRRLLYCGEWIESHVLHVFMLHAPDFLGYESSISMAAQPSLRPVVEMALRMKKAGNDLVAAIGGRAIHPVSVCVGGFYRAPRRSELRALLPELEWGLEKAVESVRWAAGLDYPELSVDYEFVALSHPDEYPMNEGEIASSTGLRIPMEAFEQHYHAEHVVRSTALHSLRTETGTSYMVGPLARFNLNADRLSPAAREVAREVGAAPPIRNPFRSLIVRLIETVDAYEEAIAIIRGYEPPEPSRTAVTLGPGTGAHATEAPRGLLFHRYRVGDDGLIAEARIVPPTAQNYRRMEDDLWQFVPSVIGLPHDQATLRCEQLVRSYDPCISCSTHFLTLSIERS
jgi:coenzyme F420-reducing hydrogenase alpha subunit